MKDTYYEVLLIGDTGAPLLNGPDPVLEELKKQVKNNTPSAIAFLGDLIYPKGMPEENHPDRKRAENVMNAQMEAVKDFKGRLIFISGNHDWNKGKKNGFDYLLRQEDFIEDYFDGRQVYLPAKGCPGPMELQETPFFTIVVINTQWWMQKGYRPIGKEHHCSVESEEEFFSHLDEVLKRNSNKRVLILGHLPIYSYSTHGGKYLLKHHLFPLTIYDKRGKYIPMPLIGSLLPLYRKYIGAKEDISFPTYRRLRNKLKNVFNKHHNLIYAAGHEHNLQYIKKRDNHYIVSGSGSKTNYVNPGKYSVFAKANQGFFKIRFYENKKVEIEVWSINKAGVEQPTFQKVIIEG